MEPTALPLTLVKVQSDAIGMIFLPAGIAFILVITTEGCPLIVQA